MLERFMYLFIVKSCYQVTSEIKVQDQAGQCCQKCKILALTATATTGTEEKISSSLLMKNPVVVHTCIVRPNIKISVRKRPSYVNGSDESFRTTIQPFIEELKQKKSMYPKTVIYCNLKWCGAGFEECVRQLSLEETKHFVSQYHAPCTEKMKVSTVESMGLKGSTKLLFATEAYSMGTDTPDIRRIIHFGVPKSMESYLQEIGRAGRDGKDADAILFFNNNDIGRNVRGLAEEMAIFCRTDTCRWKFLCQHFCCVEDSNITSHRCCDNCSARCTCLECVFRDSLDDEMVIDSTRRNCVEMALLKYFAQENIIVDMPNPMLYTGLSTELAHQISLVEVDKLEERFGFISSQYLKNIICIIKSLR